MTNQRSSASTVAILLLLFVLALAGFVGSIAFGSQTVSDNIIIDNNPQMSHSYPVTSDTGWNGGAIGCGIFGAAALFGFVKLYIAKTN